MQTTDYSARAGTQYSGGMTSQVASALAAARSLARSQHGPGDASIRYGRAHFAPSQEGFAQQFGPYAGALPMHCVPVQLLCILCIHRRCTCAMQRLWPHRVSAFRWLYWHLSGSISCSALLARHVFVR